MSNDWTNKLRDRMTDYQEPVKDDLWAAIEQSLAQESSKKSTARIFSFRRISIAAAIATLAVGGSYVFLHPWGDNADMKVASVLKSNEPVGNEIDEAASSSVVAKKASTLANKINSLLKEKAHGSSINEMALASDGTAFGEVFSGQAAFEEVVSEGMTSSSTDSVKAKTSVIEGNTSTVAMSNIPRKSSAEQASSRQNKKVAESNNVYREVYGSSHHVGKRNSDLFAFNVYGENGFVGNNTSGNQTPFMSSSSDPVVPPMLASTDRENTPVFDSKVVGLLAAQEYQQEAKHHLPVSVGLQVGFGIAPRLTLTTGVVYTKASSDFTVSAHHNESVTTQDLHYVGIPLNLSYEIWGTKQFHTYVTVGGEGAVNVKNSTKSDGVEVSSKRDKMQWSGKASVGAQLDIVPQLGIYVEPGAKYYFDNGSQIENTFKDKKLNFNFQFGLRWNVGK